MATKSQNSASLADPQIDEIETILHLSEDMSKQFLNERFADITFITDGGERVPAHRSIIAARSSYFEALLYGGLAETTQDEVKIQAPAESFKLVLKFLYSGRLSMDSIDNGTLLRTLSLADQYCIESLETKIAKHLEKNLSVESVGATFDLALQLGLHSFVEKSLSKFMDSHAVEILRLESSSSLSRASVCDLLKRDSFCAPEVEIFRFVRKWLKQNLGEVENAAEVTSLIRLPLLTHDQLLDEVVPCGLFEAQPIFEALSAKRFPEKLVKRRAVDGKREINVNLTMNHAHLETNNMQYITLGLNDIHEVNHIRMKFSSEKKVDYSYYIEISLDKDKWERVVDYRTYRCRSWQNLYFSTRLVRYIRFVGTKNGLCVNSFEVKYVEYMPRIHDQIVEPIESVATVDMGAEVIAGGVGILGQILGSVDNLLDGKLSYGRYSGYVGANVEGHITIQLAQPYVIGSMRLLLYSLDDMSYKFYLETSIDGNKWEMAVDKRNSLEREWVDSTFDPRPTVFIRITGIGCSKPTYGPRALRCVHFECPSSLQQGTSEISTENAPKRLKTK